MKRKELTKTFIFGPYGLYKLFQRFRVNVASVSETVDQIQYLFKHCLDYTINGSRKWVK